MTYNQHPVCRRGGCNRPTVDDPGLLEVDRGFCAEHLEEVRAVRARLAGVNKGGGRH